VSGWGQHLDDLASATAALLSADPIRTRPMQDIAMALGCRDAVVSSLRDLVGAVSHAPRIAAVAELTLADVTQQPAPALHKALSALPRAVPFGTHLQVDHLDPSTRGTGARLPAPRSAWSVTSTLSGDCPALTPGRRSGTWPTSLRHCPPWTTGCLRRSDRGCPPARTSLPPTRCLPTLLTT
jgi:hypothetical protein